MPVAELQPLPAGPPHATILVVDDSAVNLQVLVRTLHQTGHRILVAKHGRAALEIVRRARPDLVLLDVMMPEVDGFEVCRAIKAHPDTHDTIVIFLSALGEVSDKVLGLEIGAADYITKPIQAEEVLARVASHLTRQYLERELRRSRDRLDRELASAAYMQQLILPPSMPEHPRLRFAPYYRTSLHAGGDYYDVLPLPSGAFALMVADVSGHGAPAAIVMAMIRAVLHTCPGDLGDPPAVLHHLNRHFEYLWPTAMFATAVYGVLDPARRELRISCAGHPPPMLVRDGDVSNLAVDAVLPLLWEELGEVPCRTIELAAGDRLLFFTDGITDRQAPDGALYDPERLRAVLAATSTLDPAASVVRLVDDLDTFAGGHEPDDDQTLVLVGID